VERTDWAALPEAVRRAIAARTGTVLSATTAADGRNSAVALLVQAARGPFFVKGLRAGHPGVVAQRREALINPHVLAVSPRLRWQVAVDGWDLLGFDLIAGRQADYTPGSPDLPLVIDVMRRIAQLTCPTGGQVKQAGQRWAGYVDSPSDLDLLCGDALLHTDYNPCNVLISDQGARVIDWAWPTRGAAFIDPACLVMRLMASGHTAAGAEQWVAGTSAWDQAPARAIDVFASATARLWTEIAAADPRPWKQHMAGVAGQWAQHRSGRSTPASS